MNTVAKLCGRLAIVMLLALFVMPAMVSAASWNGIEPFKTRRDDVIKILGAPIGESPDGVARFKVMGGSVQVSFVNERFVTAKKLKSELVGTVLEVVLQHEKSSDTPESLKLAENKSFVRDESKGMTIFRNVKEGLIYTFIDGSLKSTRYTFADDQLNKARR